MHAAGRPYVVVEMLWVILKVPFKIAVRNFPAIPRDELGMQGDWAARFLR